ncbi:MAG: hypothetical protein JXQ27_16280 [Acidobacteria bacterium]|nr:hypothetical protein [Acidobacteriota bacterium]
MTCEEIRQQIADYLTDESPPLQQAAVREHCRRCAACRHELEEITRVWQQLGILTEEQPGEQLRANFYQMLASYRAGLDDQPTAARFRPGDWLRRHLWPLSPAWQLALVVLVLVTGWLTRPLVLPEGPDPRLAEMQQQMEQLRMTVALSMLKQSSATDRLQAISWGTRLTEPAPEVVTALLTALDRDPNVNVRLAAAEALFTFRANAAARQGLLAALRRQDSPLVQLALIDTIVRLDEPQVPQVLREFMQRPLLNPAVAKEAAKTLVQFGEL